MPGLYGCRPKLRPLSGGLRAGKRRGHEAQEEKKDLKNHFTGDFHILLKLRPRIPEVDGSIPLPLFKKVMEFAGENKIILDQCHHLVFIP